MFKERLRQERDRLDLNQTDFAEACGVKRNAQAKYEKGERHPDTAYLDKASRIGVDVVYLLTGVRTPEAELKISEKLHQVIQEATEAGNLAGASNLAQANEQLNADRIKRAENHAKREDEVRQVLYCLLEMDDATFERTSETVKDIYFGAKRKAQAAQAQEDAPATDSADMGSDTGKVTQQIHQEHASIEKSVVNSPNSTNTLNFNEGGFSEMPFLLSSLFCAFSSWGLAALANFEPDVVKSIAFGVPAIFFLVAAICMMLFAHFADRSVSGAKSV